MGCAIANEKCDYLIKTANAPSLDVDYSHAPPPPPRRCTCGKRRCSFSRLAQAWVSFCLGVWQGVQLRLPSSTLGLTGFWDARGEAELSASSGNAVACAAPFAGRYGASICQTALAGSPDVGFWLFPHQGQGQIPSSDQVSLFVLIDDLKSRELWIALVA